MYQRTRVIFVLLVNAFANTPFNRDTPQFILGIDRRKTAGSDVYVARVGKRGDFKMSKPCPMCESALRHVGIRRVIYTINNKTAGSYKL